MIFSDAKQTLKRQKRKDYLENNPYMLGDQKEESAKKTEEDNESKQEYNKCTRKSSGKYNKTDSKSDKVNIRPLELQPAYLDYIESPFDQESDDKIDYAQAFEDMQNELLLDRDKYIQAKHNKYIHKSGDSMDNYNEIYENYLDRNIDESNSIYKQYTETK